MTPKLRRLMASVAIVVVLGAAGPAHAQKPGGVLRMFSPDSPASMSILEESTAFSQRPMMAVFNNLVIYDQHVKQNSPQSIVPDLATGWSCNEDGTELTLLLHQVSNGTTASPSRLGTSNARGTCCRARRAKRCASILGNPGTATSRR
jgi:ABC-type transport system substrate-binding protein